jgi:ABC-type antimicrobial peptide transport system permease subunit
VALGAGRQQVLWFVLRRALLQLAWGFGLGTAATFAVFTLLRTIIFDNVGPDDPITISAIIFVLLCVSLAAALFPALRAMRLSPVAALRHD